MLCHRGNDLYTPRAAVTGGGHDGAVAAGKPHHAPPFSTAHCPDLFDCILPVPGFRQARSYACGFASALMVARYFCPKTSAQGLFARLGTGPSGTRQTAIVRALRGLGIRVGVRYDMTFFDLCRAVDGGRPVIAYFHDDEHWVVIYGYGMFPERVFIADPEAGCGVAVAWTAADPRLRSFGMVCSRGRAMVDPRRLS